MKILMIGPQGSGKSTQADLLTKKLNIPKISTGDIFRKIREEDSEEGRRIKQILDAGQLVDDQTTSKIVKERLSRPDCQMGFVLDGYPRNIGQLGLFDPQFNKAIYLDVPEQEVISRLAERGRSDDTQQSIKRRLNLYYLQTQPLLDYYKKQGMLVEVNGIGDIQTVQDEIKKSL